ncbi:MAG: YbaN family protein [Albidovulum sp.]
MRWLWATAGIVALALGAMGMFLPLLPTVPFLLAAGFFFGKSSPRLHRWLLQHPVFGPPIHDWNQRGAISRRAKLLASLSIAAALGLSLALGFSGRVIAIQTLALFGVSIFIWTRPNS